MWGLEDIELGQSREFRFLCEKNEKDDKEEEFYFVNVKGKKVLTDKVGKAVWEALPETGERICEKVQKKWMASKRLIYEFLYVLAHAGIIQGDGPFQKELVPEDKEDPAQEKARELVSVIVVTYNGEDYIERCLDSIRRQSYKNTEVLCVDNHSTDNTVNLVKEKSPEVRIMALKKNGHYAGGINKGLERAKGRYFLILNQDTELDKDCVRKLVEKAQSASKAGAVVPEMKFARLHCFINGIGNQINNRSWGTDNFIYCVDIGQFEELKEVPSACFGAVLLSREAVGDVGSVDENYGSFYEDVDWSLRCWFQGWKVVPEPEALVYHEFGGSYPEGKKLFFAVRNRLRMVLKLFQGRVRLGFLKNYILEDVRCVLSFVKKGQMRKTGLYVKAYLSLVFQLPEIWLKRRNVMRKKKKGMRERKVLEKNPSFYCCLDPALEMPEISAAVIRRYYRWHLLEKEDTFLASPRYAKQRKISGQERKGDI